MLKVIQYNPMGGDPIQWRLEEFANNKIHGYDRREINNVITVCSKLLELMVEKKLISDKEFFDILGYGYAFEEETVKIEDK